MEREFKEGSVEQSLIMELMRPWGQTYFLWLFIFFQRFWAVLKKDVLAFIRDFYSKGKLSKGLGSSFADSIKDFRSLSFTVGIYKILIGRLQEVLLCPYLKLREPLFRGIGYWMGHGCK